MTDAYSSPLIGPAPKLTTVVPSTAAAPAAAPAGGVAWPNNPIVGPHQGAAPPASGTPPAVPVPSVWPNNPIVGTPAAAAAPAAPPPSTLDAATKMGADYAESMGTDYGKVVGDAWNTMLADYDKATGKPPKDGGLWDTMKDRWQRFTAAGMLPVDAVQAALSPLTGLVKAGPAKAIATGEHALLSMLPDSNRPISEEVRKGLGLPEGRKTVMPSQEELENDVMNAFSMVAPERGMRLGAPAAGVWRAPTLDQLEAEAKAAYHLVDNSGMRVTPTAFRALAGDVERDMHVRGHRPVNAPMAEAALDEMRNMVRSGNHISVQDMDVWRKVAQRAEKSANENDRDVARLIRNHIDDFVENLNPRQLAGQVDHAAIRALRVARSAWRRMSKGEIIARQYEKAGNSAGAYSQSGYENALRGRFRQLANNDNAIRRFTPQEQAAIRRVARGGPIGNTLRQVGKAAPHTLSLPSMVGMAAGAGEHGILGALGVGAGAEAARLGATFMTARNARLADELIRRGYSVPAMATRLGITVPQAAALLTSIGGTQSRPQVQLNTLGAPQAMPQQPTQPAVPTPKPQP